MDGVPSGGMGGGGCRGEVQPSDPKEAGAGEHVCVRFLSYDQAVPIPASSKWLLEAVSQWQGARSTYILQK